MTAPSLIYRRGRATALLCGVLALGTAIVVACGSERRAREPSIKQRVLDLMECYECVDGELDSVVALGVKAVPMLRTALLQGPDSDRYARMDSSLRFFTQPRPSDTVISQQMESYRALYRLRAPRALVAIGGAAAAEALCAARSIPQLTARDRVALDSAIRLVGGICP